MKQHFLDFTQEGFQVVKQNKRVIVLHKEMGFGSKSIKYYFKKDKFVLSENVEVKEFIAVRDKLKEQLSL